MKNIIFSLLALLIVLNLPALDLERIDVGSVLINDLTRMSSVNYHNFSEDYHLVDYNSIWAVKFEFNQFDNESDSVSFDLQNIEIYFPDVENLEMKLSLAKNGVGQPGEILYDYGEQNITANSWNSFECPEDISQLDSLNVAWVIIDYETSSENNSFMAASEGTGEHSYYLDSYYKQFDFPAELLVTANGYFNFDTYDFELAECKYKILNNKLLPDSINIVNNSDQIIEDLFLKIKYESSDTLTREHSDSLIYQFPQGFSDIDEEKIISFDDYPEELEIDLSPFENAQYKLQYEVYSETQNQDKPENNFSEQFLDDFPVQFEQILTENFLRAESLINQTIWDQQDQDGVSIINYFPNASDEPYYSNSAMAQFNNYSFFSIPKVVLQGTQKLEYRHMDNFEDYLVQVKEEEKTFLNIEINSLEFYDNRHYKIDFLISNLETYLFEDFIDDLELKTAAVDSLLEDDTVSGNTIIKILDNYSSNSELDSLNYNHSIVRSFEFDYDSFEPIINTSEEYKKNQCSILYWLKNKETGKIYDFGYVPLNLFEFTSTNDNINKLSEISVFPNPSTNSSSIKVKIKNDRDFNEAMKRIDIFNLRGQKVNSLNFAEGKKEFSWNKKDNHNKTVQSGIYFIRIETEENNYLKKIVILK